MKKFMYIKNMTVEQANAKSRIIELESVIRHAGNLAELVSAFNEAQTLWDENFQTEELMNPNPDFKPLHRILFDTQMKKFAPEQAVAAPKKPEPKPAKPATPMFTFKGYTFQWV